MSVRPKRPPLDSTSMADPKEDQIVYLRISKGGGVDGLDHTDKGGKVLQASFSQSDIKLDGWSSLEKRVVTMREARKEALDKLNPLDKLVLGLSGETP